MVPIHHELFMAAWEIEIGDWRQRGDISQECHTVLVLNGITN